MTTNPQQAECPTCGRKCSSKSGLTNHMNAMHLQLSTTQLDAASKYRSPAPIEAQEAIDPKEIRREADGRYGFDGNWERLCVCGHSLGVHAAQNDTGKRPCFNEDSGIVGGTGEPCDCKHFRPSKKKPHPEATPDDEQPIGLRLLIGAAHMRGTVGGPITDEWLDEMERQHKLLITQTAARMAVEGRIDELEQLDADRLSMSDLPGLIRIRLAELQRQLKEKDQ